MFNPVLDPAISIKATWEKDGSQSTGELKEISETLLDAFDNSDKKLPAGCRGGSCGACTVEVSESLNRILKPKSAIEEDTLQSVCNQHGWGIENFRLACRARILESTELEPTKGKSANEPLTITVRNRKA